MFGNSDFVNGGVVWTISGQTYPHIRILNSGYNLKKKQNYSWKLMNNYLKALESDQRQTESVVKHAGWNPHLW